MGTILFSVEKLLHFAYLLKQQTWIENVAIIDKLI